MIILQFLVDFSADCLRFEDCITGEFTLMHIFTQIYEWDLQKPKEVTDDRQADVHKRRTEAANKVPSHQNWTKH